MKYCLRTVTVERSSVTDTIGRTVFINYHLTTLFFVTMFRTLFAPFLRQQNRILLLRKKSYSMLYRVIHEEEWLFCVVIVSVIVRKEVHMNLCVILDCYRNRAVWISRPNSVSFLFAGSNVECCCLHNEAGNQLRRTTRDPGTRGA